jgi:leucyl aminopeptidase (aminopeptidase T)
MSLRAGAETIVNQCMKIQPDEHVLVVNDGNDQDLIDALLEVLEDEAGSTEYVEYEEPENHGDEPPERVSEAMRKADAVIAPTKKSLTHTNARRDACDAGVRVATLPGINKKIWNTSLQADYQEVKRISEKVYSMLEDTDEVRIKTPSGTDLRFEIDIDLYHTDTGIIDQDGNFGNLPAGEADGGVLNASGTLVIDHFPFAPEGTEVEIEDSEAVAIRHPDNEGSELSAAFSDIDGARNVAEFGFGTNPEATLIGNVLQDEKVLGTVHIAFGDNSSYMPDGHERKVECEIHWDTVCESPTVWFDDRKVLDSGEPVFLD